MTHGDIVKTIQERVHDVIKIIKQSNYTQQGVAVVCAPVFYQKLMFTVRFGKNKLKWESYKRMSKKLIRRTR